MEQGSLEWKMARCGKVTASRLADIMARTKSGYAATRDNYMHELLIERLTGQPSESYQSPAMRWGIEQEPFARAEYEARMVTIVEQVGFINHPRIFNFGASPDGLVDDGLIEIKCPETKEHVRVLLGGSISQRYILQMHGQMMCTSRPWCDFVSYDFRMPYKGQILIKRVPLDNALVAEIETEIIKFLADLDELEYNVRSKLELS